MSAWTRVEDGLPEDTRSHGPVLFATVRDPYGGANELCFAIFHAGAWYFARDVYPDMAACGDVVLMADQGLVVAWMPAPEPYRDPEPMPPLG